MINNLECCFKIDEAAQLKNGADPELSSILRRLFFRQMISYIWWPLAKILLSMIFKKIRASVMAYVAKILSRKKDFIIEKYQKFFGKMEEESNCFEDAVFIDLPSPGETSDDEESDEKKKISSILKILLSLPTMRYIWWPLIKLILSKMGKKMQNEIRKYVKEKLKI